MVRPEQIPASSSPPTHPGKPSFGGYTVTTRVDIGFSGVFTVTPNGYIMVTVTSGPSAGVARASPFLPPHQKGISAVTVTTRVNIGLSGDSTVTSNGHIMVMVTVTIRVSENS